MWFPYPPTGSTYDRDSAHMSDREILYFSEFHIYLFHYPEKKHCHRTKLGGATNFAFRVNFLDFVKLNLYALILGIFSSL